LDDRTSVGPRPDQKRHDESTGLAFLLGEMEVLRSRGLVGDEAYRTIVCEYSARRDALVRIGQLETAIARARELAIISPREALAWSDRARELGPERPEGWVAGIDLLRRTGRSGEADQLAQEAAQRFPGLAWHRGPARAEVRTPSPVTSRLEEMRREPARPPVVPPPGPTISWTTVASEFLEEHWQKLILGLAVSLIVVSSTVGASLVLGPLLWSSAGKVVLALLFTAACSGFGLGLERWGAGRAGRVMLATSLILIPIDLMLVGELRLLVAPSAVQAGLVALDLAALFVLARFVVSALGFRSGSGFAAAFFALAVANAGASRGMPFEAGFALFLAPAAIFLGAVYRLNARALARSADVGKPTGPDQAYVELGLLAFAFLSGVIRTGAVVLQLGPALYAIPSMLVAMAAVSTSRGIGRIDKDPRRVLLLQQGGLVLSALAFALARPAGTSTLDAGNTLAVAVLGLWLYATSLRATRQPFYLYCGLAAFVAAYFGAYDPASDLARSAEEVAGRLMGYDRGLPMPFRAINGLVFNVGLAWLARGFARSWSDDRLSRHCHYIGLPLSVAACVFSGFEPRAAVICMGGYAVAYAIGARIFAEPRLIYLACAASAGSAFFGASLVGWATLVDGSLIAASLGLAFRAIGAIPALKRAGEPYRTPLTHSALVMAVVAMAAASTASLQVGAISPGSTLAFLLASALAWLASREAPRTWIDLLAIAGLLGAWLGGTHIASGGQPATAMGYGLAIAEFLLVLLAAGEVVRARGRGAPRSRAFLDAMGRAVPVLALVAWSLAGSATVAAVPVARSFLVGSVALLWLTRFRRESALVHLGLGGLVAWAACLCVMIVPDDRPGRLAGWLAITLSGCSLASWGAGEAARRRGGTFSLRPLFLVALALAVGASAMAVGARWASADSYRLGVAAMLLGSLSAALIAASLRWPAAVGLAAGSVVGASYLALLSQGPARPESAWVLALVASLESIACGGAALVIRRLGRSPSSPTARPLDFAALGLMVAAIPLGYRSPPTMLLVAASSLLMVARFPSARWLYLTFIAVGSAIYHACLSDLSGDGLLPFVVLGAYAAWGVGVALQRSGARLRDRFGLADLELEVPPVRMAVAFGVLAAAIRLEVVLAEGGGWASSPWLPWTLAGLCLLMLRFQPGRGWVDVAVALTGLGFAATLAPLVQPRGWWLSEGMALASFWAMAGRGASRIEGPLCRRLGLRGGLEPGVVDRWAVVAFGLSGSVVLALVLTTTFLTVRFGGGLFLDLGWFGGWSDVLLAIGLAGLFVGVEGRRHGVGLSLLGFEAVGILAAWWLGAPGSPLPVRAAIDPAAYLSLATAAWSLVVVLLGRRAEVGSRLGLVDRSEPIGFLRSSPLVRSTSLAGFGLALASIYLSAFASGRIAWLVLLPATISLALLALGWRRVESAIAAGMTWCLAWALGLVLAARFFGVTGPYTPGQLTALGLGIGLATLWAGAGWVRARGYSKGGDPARDGRIARAMEWVALGASIPSAWLAAFGGPGSTGLGSGILLSLAVFFAMVARRRVAEWPVYAAQGLLMACYFRAREVIVPSGVVDAVLLSMFAYLDLGLSELMARLRQPHFARPTLRFAMLLPLVPIVQGIWFARADGADLFVLFASAGFYALAGLRIRSRTPAYAAAVLFNAFLWVGWYRLGWRFAERPEFYLMPVGFSSILFGEVNRKALGRATVNGARNLGLIVIDASLAVPIYQAESFGAWLTLLLVSLAGIFAGIGLRVQSFLWLGLAGFVAGLVYELGRLGMEHALARWGVMLTLGVALVLLVAFNEKKRIVATMRLYYDEARTWD